MQDALTWDRTIIWVRLQGIKRHIFHHHSGRTCAASAIQHWHRRAARRRLFLRVADALYFQPTDVWNEWAEDATLVIAKILHRQREKLSSAFIFHASHSWLLLVIDKGFPGIDSPYNLVPIPSLRAWAYSLTARNLAYNAVAWATSGYDEWTFAATLVDAAGLFLRTARGLPSSMALDLSVDFSSAQLSIDRARKATSYAFDLPSHNTLDPFADASVEDNAEENVLGNSIAEKSTLETANAEENVLDISFEGKACVDRALNHARTMLGSLETKSSQLELAITASATSPFDWILHGLKRNIASATQAQRLIVTRLERQLSSIELGLVAQRLSWC